VPLLVRALGFPTHVATATSHFVLGVMAAAGTLTHAVTGSFEHGDGLHRAGVLSLAVVVGAPLGARISLRVRGRSIEWLIAVALLALAVRLFIGRLTLRFIQGTIVSPLLFDVTRPSRHPAAPPKTALRPAMIAPPSVTEANEHRKPVWK
jgi:hypothetical protein